MRCSPGPVHEWVVAAPARCETMTAMWLSSNRRRLGAVVVAVGCLVLGACNDHKPVAVVDDDAGSDGSADGAMMASEASVDASEGGPAEAAAEAASDATSDGPGDAGNE